MIEFLFEFVGEFLLQILVEVSVELGARSLTNTRREPLDPWLAVLGYTLAGAVLGGLSLMVFSAHLTPPGALRVLNLVLTPLAVGGLMVALGAWRTRRGQALVRIDRFFCGYLFALSFALVRFFFAQ